jgi:outer membrane protein TolC
VQEVKSIEAGSSLQLPEVDAGEVRPDIKALELEAQSVMYEAQTKKSENYPSIFFENTLSRSEYYFDDKSKESTFLVETQNIATINVAWNILDFGATQKSYEAKQYEYLSKKASLEHEKNKAEVDYRLAKKAYEIAKLKIEATKATLDATAATYELVKLKYQNGTIDNVAYLQALSEKYDAQRGYERAKNDLEVKKAEVLFYGGQTIKEFF